MMILRSLFLAVGISAVTGASAWAADASVDAAPLPPSSETIYIWSGPYAGAFVGYNFSDIDQSTGADFDGSGVVGGVYAGYNVQSGPVIFGVEGDLGYSGLDADGFNTVANAPIEADANAFGSLRGRIGVAADPFLVFATGGLAVANKELTSAGGEDDNTHVGYTVGAGVEAKITDRIDTRLEYRYSDFESETYNFGTTSTSAGFDEHSVRAGLALKF